MLTSKTIEQIQKRLVKMREWVFAKISDVPLEAAVTMEHYRVPPESLAYAPAPVGSTWGEHWATVWFRGETQIPKEARGKKVFYRHRFAGERLLFINGEVAAGMDPYHQDVVLTPKAKGGEQFQLHVEGYCGHPMWEVDPFHPKLITMHGISGATQEPPPLPLVESALVYERTDLSAILFDLEVLYQTALIQDTNSLRRASVLETIRQALDAMSLQWKDEEELSAAVTEIQRMIAPIMKYKNAPTTPWVGIVGHAHIDVGWLWPVRESIRKSARTFSTVLKLMDEYPQLTFQQSQAVLYDMIEQHYPALLTRIKKRVKEGRWEPNGCMWVEADCNVSGGEALVRQLLEGRKKFYELFGYVGDTLWLPDVFGYSAALPQLLRKSGIVNFVTSKINWNDTNRFPYDTFLWRGIDGTEIFTAFITTRTNGYNADVTPSAMQETWNYVQQKELQDRILTSVGWGDGGGGPSREMCERAKRMEDLEGCPKTSFVNVSQFLKELREQKVKRPCWTGELYLEYHRGTYTSQSRIKQWNRKMECLLRDTEILSLMAERCAFTYPAALLTEQWRTLLTNQFHDILPGTSIREVYQVAEDQYRQMQVCLHSQCESALTALSRQYPPDSDNQAWIIANTLSWDRTETIVVPDTRFDAAVDESGALLRTQKTQEGLAVHVMIRALSTACIALRNKGTSSSSPFSYSGKLLESPFYKFEFDKAGRIISLLDKQHNRDIVAPGRWLNGFYTAEDMPLFWDAWDLDRYYRDTMRYETRLQKREVIEDGPLFIRIRSEYKIGRNSSLRQDMVVYASSRRIEFQTEVDWKEKHTVLKVGFALHLCADSWRNEIQFGHTVRPLHSNTSWDQARFEVCAHKWVDISETGYGVALMNDCKYGHDCLDDMISLTLLRSPQAPDPEADQGMHHFTYALLPHHGEFAANPVIHEAYALNFPLHFQKISDETQKMEVAGPLDAAFFSLSDSNIIVEAIKKAEEDEAIILRLYESEKRRTTTRITFGPPLKRVVECSMMEEEEQSVPIDDNSFETAFAPFEIKTLKVVFKS